ncbi:MAG: 3-methyl-2-oxobutanoate dehydrogenase subunit VorB [Flavobacteriales bacterium CG_4_9_14_0_2_um_filter_35_242]|nr:3-methyl-2-oxobutanoate dehydrogenase subunit VorB [Zetaproteobacteria bacterium]PIV17629.1 MAG: 3-methyl-2-oxobutanoate dehydrogenase subunit VorB [Flavobacteriales bacterium CG03_land_8_20_14_0_80_35_15]PJC60042.1 MAG: 3-methyl-2-oxobutanoate dehydrogenase subunit VorB [Flavobacteriales bacterium CG_4_9_14_0_2_um_filter_35_242]
MMAELKLMKGNEALAEATIRAGADAYFGYPITPQTEVIEYLMEQQPEKRTGMIVLQAESELAAINMVYGAASTGKKVMTSSSSPGISLKQEGISYMAGAELPGVIVNVVRGGPGLGTIQPSQADYFQSVKGGGHGDYKLYVLAPASVQEMYDFVEDAFDIAFKYRAPVLILSDGIIGQMMEKVYLKDQKPRMTNDEIIEKYGNWATTGKKGRERNIITSLDLQSEKMEKRVHRLMKKYKQMEAEDLRFEKIACDDADYLIVAYGSSARISQKAVELARKKGIKVGLLRPITLFPFPKKALFDLANQVKGILSVELNAGQMVEDVRLSVEHKVPVEHFGRTGGIIHTPEEILEALEQKIINNGSIRHHKTRESSIL